MKQRWKEQTTLDKILTLARLLGSFATIVLAMTQLLGIWDVAIYAFIPMMGVVVLLQAVQEWRKTPGVARFSLGAGIFLMVCTAILWLRR